jgi:hypothetical protein
LSLRTFGTTLLVSSSALLLCELMSGSGFFGDEFLLSPVTVELYCSELTFANSGGGAVEEKDPLPVKIN